MAPPGPTDELCERAFELWVEGYTDREIAAEMKEDMPRGGGHTTAIRWRKRGAELYADKTDLGRKQARYRQAARLDLRLKEIKADMDTARISRDKGYALLLQLEPLIARLYGTDAPPRRPKNGDGGGVPPSARTLDLLAAAADHYLLSDDGKDPR